VLGNYDIDDKELAQIYLNLGYAYAGLKQYEMAGTYFNKSCETAETVYKVEFVQGKKTVGIHKALSDILPLKTALDLFAFPDKIIKMVNYIRMDYLLSRFNKRSEFMNLLDRLERKFGKFAIKRLPMYIVILNLFVYMLNLLDSRYINYLYLIPSRVLKGEIWRLVTYIFIPPMTSMEDVFYYIMATGLENEWGSFKFNLYYLLGMIGTTIAAFFIPLPATASFINLSIFLAFAYLYPDYQIYLFFFDYL